MRKSDLIPIASAITFLFFIQLAGTLVESIYILNLLNTALDEKVLGLFFFFSPILLLVFREKIPVRFTWVIFAVLFLARGITPYLSTNGRMLAAGLGTAALLLFIPALVTAKPKNQVTSQYGYGIAVGLALGVGLSVLLRTVNYSIDYSLTTKGSWVGWSLGLLLGFILSQLEWNWESPAKTRQQGRVTAAAFGIFLVIALVYFVFSAPAVLTRWTDGHYPLIISTTSFVTLGWVVLTLLRPGWLNKISPRTILLWNGMFTIFLLVTILVHRVPFPPTPESAAVVIKTPTLFQQIPAILTLLLYPVLFLDFHAFVITIQQAKPPAREFVPGMILGSLSLILFIFMLIFSNVWGYVEPVSTFFRNKFWLPFALITILITLLGISNSQKIPASPHLETKKRRSIWTLLLGVIFLLTTSSSLLTTRTTAATPVVNTLLVMTYNIQAGNDRAGEKAYEQQLELIQQVSPDILALQESDTTRISLNNNDYVRYFAGRLGYYSYYGPTTVAGTFGTAILSRYPLYDTHTLFSYSDQDEIGTAVASIEVGDQTFTIYNVHPDGSDAAMIPFAHTLLADATGKERVIALGDYNLREDEVPYQIIDSVFTNAWASVYPSGISNDGLDMSGTKRIDHIFLSPDLQARNPVYLLEPDSHTDHPVHWVQVFWIDSSTTE